MWHFLFYSIFRNPFGQNAGKILCLPLILEKEILNLLMIHPVLDQVALHQAVQVQAVLIALIINQKITMELLVKMEVRNFKG